MKNKAFIFFLIVAVTSLFVLSLHNHFHLKKIHKPVVVVIKVIKKQSNKEEFGLYNKNAIGSYKEYLNKCRIAKDMYIYGGVD